MVSQSFCVLIYFRTVILKWNEALSHISISLFQQPVFIIFILSFSRWLIVLVEFILSWKSYSLISHLAIPWICKQRTSFYYHYVLSFAASPSKLIDLRIEGFCVMIVSSSNTNNTPFFQSSCYMLIILYSLFSFFVILSM